MICKDYCLVFNRNDADDKKNYGRVTFMWNNYSKQFLVYINIYVYINRYVAIMLEHIGQQTIVDFHRNW